MKFLPPPLVLLACLALCGLASYVLPTLVFDFPSRLEMGALLVVVAINWELWLLRQFRKAKTTFNPIEVSKSSELITSGVYAYSRNPMYLGQIVVLLGAGLMIGSSLVILMLPLFFFFMDSLGL